jgi:hypothetical protein
VPTGPRILWYPWAASFVSALLRPTILLFVWDPGGSKKLVVHSVLLLSQQLRWHMCMSSYYRRKFAVSLLFRNNEPKCKRLNVDAKFCVESSQVISKQQLEDELLKKGGSNVMGS